jgi:molecular chaperone DnaJ
MIEAALGTTATVPALGGDVELDVPAGTQPGSVRVLEGQGMPALRGSRRGDLFVTLDVAVPMQLSEEQRRLLEALGRELGPESYARLDDVEHEGLFQRLKNALR